MEEREFLKAIKKVDQPREHKITNSLGVYDAYKYYRKNKPKDKKFVLTESQYFAIIRRINEALKGTLYQSNDIIFPERMGMISVRKYDAGVTRKDGKIKTTYPIDWDATLKLWYEDPQSYKDKLLVRMIEPEIFRIVYDKSKALYENKTFYQFSPNRDLRLGLKRAIKTTHFDAFKK